MWVGRLVWRVTAVLGPSIDWPISFQNAVQNGRVKLTVVSKIGKEATIGILSEGNFFGEGSLAGQVLRMGSAAAMTDCELLRVEKQAMMDALHREHTFSDMFVAYLLARNI